MSCTEFISFSWGKNFFSRKFSVWLCFPLPTSQPLFHTAEDEESLLDQEGTVTRYLCLLPVMLSLLSNCSSFCLFPINICLDLKLLSPCVIFMLVCYDAHRGTEWYFFKIITSVKGLLCVIIQPLIHLVFHSVTLSHLHHEKIISALLSRGNATESLILSIPVDFIQISPHSTVTGWPWYGVSL